MPITEIVFSIFIVLILLFLGFRLLQRYKIVKGENEDIERLIQELTAEDEKRPQTAPTIPEQETDTAEQRPNTTRRESQELQETTSPLPATAEEFSHEEKKLHEKAQRKARVIIREIEMYHKEKTEIGLREGNLYKYLKDEIETGKLTYEQSVPEHIRKNTDYFEESLITILAQGKKEVLGR